MNRKECVECNGPCFLDKGAGWSWICIVCDKNNGSATGEEIKELEEEIDAQKEIYNSIVQR